jgi:rod shape-determining protein MreC
MIFKRVGIRFILLSSAFFLLMAAIILNTGDWQQKCMACVTYPFLVIENTCVTPVKNWLHWRQGAKDLRDLAYRLTQERNDLLKENSALQAQLDYLSDCAECIDFKKRYNFDRGIIAQVLLKNCSTRAHFFLLDAGSSKGIKKDMVAVHNNHLVGRVSEVYPWYCKVVLITDSACHVAAKCRKTGSQGIQSGLNQFSTMDLSFVSHLDEIAKDDLVFSHGDGLVFPRGFALGKVADYYAVGVHKKVIVKPLIDFETIDFCLLIDRDFVLEN